MLESGFLFTCCQLGAEAALKNEITQQWPEWRFAFSRPGFVTFKMTGDSPLPERLQLKSVFVRTFGYSIGPIETGQLEQAAELTRDSGAKTPFGFLHVWPRDTQMPGENGFVPGPTPQAEEIGSQLLVEGKRQGIVSETARLNAPVRVGQRVWDLILVDSDRWWLGWHVASCFIHRWPGGVLPVRIPENMVSRAYLKTREALAWSGMPIRPGDRFLEIGSAPGGSCQALLERGLHVMGVDPSEMHPSVLQHPHFTHVQKRGADLRRRELRGFKWMLVDSNVAPQHTLDTVEALVTHPATNFQGLLLTLKLPDWKLADQVAEYAQRVRDWGFPSVRCRQLAYQRQEVCLAAFRHRTLRRLPRRRS